MICTKCGNNNPDVAQFCLICGSPLNQQPPNSSSGQVPPPNNGFNQPQNGGNFGQIPPQNNGFNQPRNGGGFGQIPPQNNRFNQPQNGGFGAPQPFGMQPVPKKKNKAALIGIAGGIAAAIALVIVLIVVFGKSSATEGQTQQQAADKYAQGINTNNMQMVVDAIMPKEAADKLKKSEDMTIKEIAEYYGGLPGEDEDVSNVKIKVKGKLEDYFDADDINYAKEEIKEEYGIKVSEIEVREIEISYKRYGDQESRDEEMAFYKYDGKWYILGF